MKRVVSEALPHGAIPFANIRDVEVRSVVMRLNENVQALRRQLVEAQDALRELQRKSALIAALQNQVNELQEG